VPIGYGIHVRLPNVLAENGLRFPSDFRKSGECAARNFRVRVFFCSIPKKSSEKTIKKGLPDTGSPDVF